MKFFLRNEPLFEDHFYDFTEQQFGLFRPDLYVPHNLLYLIIHTADVLEAGCRGRTIQNTTTARSLHRLEHLGLPPLLPALVELRLSLLLPQHDGMLFQLAEHLFRQVFTCILVRPHLHEGSLLLWRRLPRRQ